MVLLLFYLCLICCFVTGEFAFIYFSVGLLVVCWIAGWFVYLSADAWLVGGLLGVFAVCCYVLVFVLFGVGFGGCCLWVCG